MGAELIDIKLGPAKSGLTLKAQLKSAAGTPVGSAITTGFIEVSAGSGSYSWSHTFADDFIGTAVFLNSADDSYLSDSKIVPPAESSGGAGSGAYVRTVTVTSNGTTPIVGAIVRLTDGQSYTATSNGSGVASFSLDTGSYTLSVTKAGYSYTPTTVTVSGAGNTTITLTAVTIPPAANADQTTAYLYTYDGAGTLEGDVAIEFRVVDPSTDAEDGAGTSYPRKPFTIRSDNDGLLETPLKKNSTYAARRGIGAWIEFETDDQSTYQLPEVLGQIEYGRQ